MPEIRPRAQFEKFVAELAGEGGDPGARTHEKLGAPRSDDAAADHDGRPFAHVDENRQVAHHAHSPSLAAMATAPGAANPVAAGAREA